MRNFIDRIFFTSCVLFNIHSEARQRLMVKHFRRGDLLSKKGHIFYKKIIINHKCCNEYISLESFFSKQLNAITRKQMKFQNSKLAGLPLRGF